MFGLMNIIHCKEVEQHKTSIRGEAVVFACTSSYTPIWEWEGKDSKENLAVGTEKRKNFQDSRYFFFRFDEETDVVDGNFVYIMNNLCPATCFHYYRRMNAELTLS